MFLFECLFFFPLFAIHLQYVILEIARAHCYCPPLGRTEVFTTGKPAIAESRCVCREQKQRLSANKTFAEGDARKEGPSANERLAVGQNLGKQKRSANWAILARGPLSAKKGARQIGSLR